jgi:hypothetical protein
MVAVIGTSKRGAADAHDRGHEWLIEWSYFV